jgi:DNA-binding NtrC family response regulator
MKRPPSHDDLGRIQAAASETRSRVLIVDDDAGRAAMLARVLAPVGECEAVHTLDQALRCLGARGWDAAVVDFDLGDDGTGFSVLQGLRLLSPRTARVLYTSYFNRGLALEAARTAHAAAAVDARRDGFAGELREVLARLLGDGTPVAAGEPAAEDAREWCASADSTLSMLRHLDRAAEADAVVFVHGEPGSGKHLAAATLQRERLRRGRPATDSRGGAERCAVRTVRVPALRERLADLPQLCARFLATMADPAELSSAALEALGRRDWWGNVGELRSVLVRARARARGRIEPDDLPHDVVPAPTELQREKDDSMTRLLLDYLVYAGSVNAASRHAEVTPSNFRRLMERHGILRADTVREAEPTTRPGR